MERLRNQLLQQGVSFSEKDGTLYIDPKKETGFPVTLTRGDDEFIVSFGTWHGHFESENEAVDFVLFGLSHECRLRELRRGKTPYRWIVEKLEQGAWEPIETTGLLIFPFWRKREEILYQNE